MVAVKVNQKCKDALVVSSGGDFTNQNIVMDKKSSVAAQVHSHLRHLILRLNLKPGEALSEKELSLKLGVSRTPVREAFIRLSEEGLVDIFPQRGTVVAPIRMAEIKEAQFLREILETSIVRRAAENIQPIFLRRLEANLLDQEKSLSRTDYTEFMELDEEFHHLLCLSVSFPRAWRVVQAVKGQLDRMRFMGLPQPGHAALMFHQHSVILDAVRNGSPEDAAKEMVKHLTEIWGSIERMTLDQSDFSVD
jgi:DNA-binding GntR family transcriptional regulator